MAEKAEQFRLDCGCAVSQGARDYQEDALVTDFARGTGVGLAVLSDGMGGHAAGDMASKIVATEVFSELTFRAEEMQRDPTGVPAILRGAADTANNCLAEYVADHPAANGMGATLLAVIILDQKLHWISIGDSPLYLYRDSRLQQLNEDHSLGPHIDMLVRQGTLTEEEGRVHPERNALTSAMLGQALDQVDCPTKAFDLKPHDVLLIASDGLQFLPEDDIARILRERPFSRSADIADVLMSQVHRLHDPDLDNVTIAVVQPNFPVDMSQPPVANEQSRPKSGWPFSKAGQSKG